jgi:hypothetical protein
VLLWLVAKLTATIIVVYATMARIRLIQNRTFTREDAFCAAAGSPLATLGLTRAADMTAKTPTGQKRMTDQTAMAQCGLIAALP